MIETDVVIVGAGPVGLALACELGWRGISCIAIERNPEFGEEPVAKINLVNARSMEFCRRWGIEREVRYGGFPDDYPMDIVFATSLRGKLIARLPYPSMGEQSAHPDSPTNRQRIPQGLLDPVLRRAAQRFESVRILFRTGVEEVSETAQGVEARCRDENGEPVTVRGKYLAACDGAHSAIRESLGIALQGEERISYSCGIYFESPHLWKLHDKGKAIMHVLVDRGGMWANLNMIDGFKTWRLSVVGGESYVPPEQLDVAGLMRRAMGGDFDYRVVGLYPWLRKAVVADSYRRGRCFLVGDSAHQLSPTGGFGMNTGMADAVDLGWKLAAVLEGWGGPSLLDSYETERLPIGARAVAEATVNFRNLQKLPTFDWIEDEGAAADTRRAELGRKYYESTRAEWESWGVQFGYRYDHSPLCIADGSAAPPDDPIVYTPSARPGGRAPHGWIAPGHSTLDLCGRGFALLDFGGDPAPLAKAAAARGVPLTVTRIDEPGLAALYGKRLCLVRPDGHVAWRGNTATEPATIIDQARGAAT